MTRSRLDSKLVEEGLADDLKEAVGLIMRGVVLVDDRPATKPGASVHAHASVRLKAGSERGRFVSRGGAKLEGALEDLGVDVSGLRCLDVGASTGGFTDCLLQRGAQAVTAVDVGYGLLADKLRRDERVTVLERVNARSLQPAQLPWTPDLVVVDASFITARALLPALCAVVAVDGALLLMVKPQFELPRGRVPDGGVVSDGGDRDDAVSFVTSAAEQVGWGLVGKVDSRVKGPRGNLERFVLLRPARSGEGDAC